MMLENLFNFDSDFRVCFKFLVFEGTTERKRNIKEHFIRYKKACKIPYSAFLPRGEGI